MEKRGKIPILYTAIQAVHVAGPILLNHIDIAVPLRSVHKGIIV